MRTIVVVNDEPSILESVRTLLEEAGHTVLAFAHGPEALAETATAAADLVITDSSNRPMRGVEFMRRVRERSNVPVIFLSAWALEVQEELRGAGLEAQDYIDLPFSGAELVRRVGALFERASSKA